MKDKILNVVPDVTLLSTIILTLALGKLFPAIEILFVPINYILGAVLVIGGLGFSIAILAFIIRQGGSTDVVKTSKLLITQKYFSISRNPLYLAECIIVVGVAVLTGSLISFIGPVVYVLVLNFVVIPHEERELEDVFGHKYKLYMQSTRRWM